MNLLQAINSGLDIAMASDQCVVCFGEDVAISPNDHTFGCDCSRHHEEQEANNDLQRCQAIQESWQPEAQL